MNLKSWFEEALKESFLSEDHEMYLLSRGASLEDLQEWKIFTFYPPSIPSPNPSFTEIFYEALLVPIFSPLGELMGFEWKKDLKEKPRKVLFKENEIRPIWFGVPFQMEKIWLLRKVGVVEGYLDALVLKRVMSLPIIAAGTANLSSSQILFLERFVDEARIFFDQDKAGDMGYWAAKKKIVRKDLKFTREIYGVIGDDPPNIWDRGGLPLLKKTFEGID